MGNPALKIDEPKGEWLSESEIAKRCNLDRATVVRRLEDLGYEPDEERSKPKLKVHFFTDEMLLEIKAAKDTFSAARLQDLRWAAKLKQQKYEKESGELVQWSVSVERMQAVVSRIYKEFVLHQPKRLAARLAKAKTAAEVTKIMKGDTEKVFAKLRESDAEFVK